MQPISSEELNELQGKCRLYLLLSVIFFMISLFSLVSRWTIAFPTIVFSCAFSLLTSRLNKRRYAEALTQRLTVCIAQQAGAEFSAYTASEALDPNRTAMGFTPDTFYVPGAKAHHVFHGMLNGKPLSISEAAFLRKNNSGQTLSQVRSSLCNTLYLPRKRGLSCKIILFPVSVQRTNMFKTDSLPFLLLKTLLHGVLLPARMRYSPPASLCSLQMRTIVQSL